jgi:hypothetical protein
MVITRLLEMDEQSKKRELSKVPMRKLMASIKQDIRRQLKTAVSSPKPQKSK